MTPCGRPGIGRHLRRLARLLPGCLALLAAAGEPPASHRQHAAEAQAAYERKDYAAARAAMARALELRPDSPRYHYHLAALSALAGDREAALASLRRVARLGVSLPAERDRDFASLQGTPAFTEILRLFAANREPHGEAEIVAELPGRTGILEGIAFRGRTGDTFFGDVHHRCIWRRDRTGQVTRFTAEDDELLGIFGLAIDESRNALWAAMAAVPEMAGYTPALKGRAALVEFSLSTSELRRIVEVPNDGRDHGLGDLLLAPDGTVYATDSLAPVVWQLAPDAEELEKACESPWFSSLQGLVLSQRTLLVADYANGLFAIDLPTGNLTALAPPPDTTLLGLDGLAAVPGGVVAVQNGVTPQRLLRIGLTPDYQRIAGVAVLAAGQEHFTDLALVTVINDRPTLLAGSGWETFERARRPASHAVRVFQVRLP